MAILDPREEAIPPDDGNKELGEEEFFEHHRIQADKGQKPMRVDVFLTTLIAHISRSRIKNATLAGCVRVNGQTIKASHKVRPGDEVTMLLPYPPKPDLEPEEMDLDIRYEDDDIMLIHKPPGLVVHPGPGNWCGTLVHGLLWYLMKIKAWRGHEDDYRPGLIHRIDKDTSGLLVIAKNEFAHSFIAKQFFDKTTSREYRAIVWGDVEKDKGTIVGNLGRSKRDRKKYVVYPEGEEGKHAVTHYEVLERFGFCTLVKCKLETGRTHQIRVHMKWLGHTLFHDTFYGGDTVLAGPKNHAYQQFMLECKKVMTRQALHAKTLGFIHPITKQLVEFDSGLPEDFQRLLEMFRNFNSGKGSNAN